MKTGQVNSGGEGGGRVKMRILPKTRRCPSRGRLMLVAQGLRKAYRSREVVRDFGLTLDAGEVVGLLGPNGAGKTTCFYMIVGLVPADAGQIVLDGKDITAEPMYARAKYGVGYLPQEPSVFRKLSVADNLRAGAGTARRPRQGRARTRAGQPDGRAAGRPMSPTRSAPACPAANAAVSRSRARWPPSRA